jgi:hypothetical protein
MPKTGILMVLVGASIAWAQPRQLTICMPMNPELDFKMVASAQVHASRIFRAIGLKLRWKGFCSAAELQTPHAVIGIQWEAQAPLSAPPRVRAVAYPFRHAGTRITLYQNRLTALLHPHDSFAAAFLGHILAHEIGHVLLGHPDHAPEGLMKPVWRAEDVTDLRRRAMRFTDGETAQILRKLDPAPVDSSFEWDRPPGRSKAEATANNSEH